MARARTGEAGTLRRLLTLVVALVLLALLVAGGTLLRVQQPGPRTTATLTTSAGRSAAVCATGAVPLGSATPTPQPSDPGPPGATPSDSPTPGATTTPVATTTAAPTAPAPTPGTTPGSATPPPGGPAPATPAGTPVPTPTPTPTFSAGAENAARGDVAAVASGSKPTATPAPEGRLTLSRLGADKTDLTIDQQGRGATLDQAAAPVLMLSEGSMATTASGAVLSDNSDGPEAGLEAAPCLPPTTSAWFPGLASGSDDRTELVLSNPDDAQAEVDLRFYGRTGRVVVPGSPGVVVAARSSRSISLTSLVDAEGPLSASVSATVGRVSAVARRIRTDGNRPAGADWVVPAATPALTAVIPAVPGEDGSRELVVTNPSTVRATVQVKVLGLQGPYAPVGAESLVLAPESSGTVSLREGLAGGAAGVEVTGDQPVTAAVTSTSSRRGAQVDIAVQSASPALVRTGVSAIATSDGTDSELVLSNGGDTDAQVRFDVLSYDGVVLRTDSVLIAADGSATRRLASPAPSYVVVHVPDGSSVVGGVVLTRGEGAVAGLSTIPLTSPDVASRAPRVEMDPAAGR